MAPHQVQKTHKEKKEKAEANSKERKSGGGISDIMDRFWSSLGDLRDPRLDTCDSYGDKLSCKTTVFLLFLFSIVLTVKQHYVGKPIQCWTPDHFKKSQINYAQQLCWINNTYFVPFNQTHLPKNEGNKSYIGYYQWTSIILSCQAVLFALPRMIWLTFNKKAGMDVTTITGAAWDCQNTQDNAGREKIKKYMANHMNRFLGQVRGKLGGSENQLVGCWWQFYGSFLYILYLAIKIVYLMNAVFQLLALEHLIGLRKHLYGVDFLQRLFSDSSGIESPLFPRVAFCDISIRRLGNVEPHTIQCSLPINLFNEKIFILVWFWLIFIVIGTSLGLFVWLWRFIYMRQHVNWVRIRLYALDTALEAPNKEFRIFVNHYLRRDGIFIMYLVAINTSDIIASEMLSELWKLFKKDRDKVDQAMKVYDEDYEPNATPMRHLTANGPEVVPAKSVY